MNFEILQRLADCFHKSIINHNIEFIAHIKTNQYFVLKDCNSEFDIKCKLLEWLSRPAYKSTPYQSKKKNEEYNKFFADGINKFLGTNFNGDDFELIYTYLGNACNHNKTIRFIESGYDMKILKESDNQ